METNLIYEFSELAKRLSITETARFLNMSQPTLSKHINQLENELHVKLFIRSSNGLRITREGLELLNESYNLIKSVEQFVEKAEYLHKNPLPHLSVAGLTNEDAIVDILGNAVSSLSAEIGPNFLEIISNHHKTPLQLVKDGLVDIAFDYIDSTEADETDSIEYILLQKIRLYAVVGNSHQFFNRESLIIEDLNGQTLLKMEGSHLTESWKKIEELISKHSITPILRHQYAMKLIDLVTASANLGNGVLILSGNFVDKVIPKNSPYVKAIPIVDDDAYLALTGIYRKDNKNAILPMFISIFETCS